MFTDHHLFSSLDRLTTKNHQGPSLKARCQRNFMMTSSNGNIFRVTQMGTFSALLAFCARNSVAMGEFPLQSPVTWSFKVFFDLCLSKLLGKQSMRRWCQTQSRSLSRHCNVLVTHGFPSRGASKAKTISMSRRHHIYRLLTLRQCVDWNYRQIPKISYSIHVPGWLLKWLNLITAPGSVSNEPGSVTWLATKYWKTVSWRNHTEN